MAMYAGLQLTSDLDVSLHNERICPETYSSSGITFTCSLKSGTELHWDINSEVEMWRSTVYLRSNDNCDIQNEESIPGLSIISHHPSCNFTETTIRSQVTVIPDPELITSERLVSVLCFTYDKVDHTRIDSLTIVIIFSSKATPN